MTSTVRISTIPTITIFVRHRKDCPLGDDEFSKRCRCSKHLRWYANGKLHRMAAKTRTWSIAEERRREVEARYAAANDAAIRGRFRALLEKKSRPTIEQAIELFLSDKLTQGLDHTAHKKHVRELGRFAEFMGKRHKFFPHEIGLADLTAFRAGCMHLQLLPHPLQSPRTVAGLSAIRLQCEDDRLCPPTVSYQGHRATYIAAHGETVHAKLLDVISVEFKNPDRVKRMHALIRLMRYSGLAIQDAVTLERIEVVWDSKAKLHSVVTSRQKTGTHVSVPPAAARCGG